MGRYHTKHPNTPSPIFDEQFRKILRKSKGEEKPKRRQFKAKLLHLLRIKGSIKDIFTAAKAKVAAKEMWPGWFGKTI